jgi:hypothetical protein
MSAPEPPELPDDYDGTLYRVVFVEDGERTIVNVLLPGLTAAVNAMRRAMMALLTARIGHLIGPQTPYEGQADVFGKQVRLYLPDGPVDFLIEESDDDAMDP